MSDQPGTDSPTLRWLGQAGFVLESTQGLRLAFDPYLSDDCERIHGLTRRMKAPVSAEDFDVETILVSHWHEDHFDLPAAKAVLRRGGTVIGPPSVAARIRGALGDQGSGVVAALPGELIEVGSATVTPVTAEHRVAGYLTEDAVGYVVDLDGFSIYHSGDTDYARAIVESVPHPVTVAMLCINGTGGNMNALEAAVFAAQLDTSLLVPMHFGMWDPEGYGPGATLDPEAFATACRGLGVRAEIHVPELDRPFSCRGAGS